LVEVKELLRLPRVPRRIECIDVSHTGGDDAVAAIVSLKDGVPEKERYRTFHVRTVRDGDDYTAMREVLSRRFKRARSGAGKEWSLPDLLVVDGGKGQLNVAAAVLADLELTEVPVVALAKEKENPKGRKVVDRVFLPGQKNPILLRESGAALQLLALARDEAHRSSNVGREKRARRRTFASRLGSIPGVGQKTRVRLLRALGSERAIMEADVEALTAAGATARQARAIMDAFAARPAAERREAGGEADTAAEAEAAALENAFVDDPGVAP
jgi:excinuclease ABC subunit C